MRRELFFCWRYDHVPKCDAALFAALQINRARQCFMTIERATGDPRNLLMIDDRPAVLGYADRSPDQRDVKGLPFPGRAWKFRRRRQETVDSTDSLARRFISGVGLDLHFVATAQIDTAV